MSNVIAATKLAKVPAKPIDSGGGLNVIKNNKMLKQILFGGALMWANPYFDLFGTHSLIQKGSIAGTSFANVLPTQNGVLINTVEYSNGSVLRWFFFNYDDETLYQIDPALFSDLSSSIFLSSKNQDGIYATNMTTSGKNVKLSLKYFIGNPANTTLQTFDFEIENAISGYCRVLKIWNHKIFVYNSMIRSIYVIDMDTSKITQTFKIEPIATMQNENVDVVVGKDQAFLIHTDSKYAQRLTYNSQIHLIKPDGTILASGEVVHPDAIILDSAAPYSDLIYFDDQHIFTVNTHEIVQINSLGKTLKSYQLPARGMGTFMSEKYIAWKLGNKLLVVTDQIFLFDKELNLIQKSPNRIIDLFTFSGSDFELFVFNNKIGFSYSPGSNLWINIYGDPDEEV